MCLLKLQKAQCCLLAQAQLLLAHWGFFQSSRLPLHHWQQVWKQQTHSQEVLHAARFFLSSQICSWGLLVFYLKYSQFTPSLFTPFCKITERNWYSWGQCHSRVSMVSAPSQCGSQVHNVSTLLRVLILIIVLFGSVTRQDRTMLQHTIMIFW